MDVDPVPSNDNDFPMFSFVRCAGRPPEQWCAVDPDADVLDDETPIEENQVPQAVRDWASDAVAQPGRDMHFVVGLRRGGGVELVHKQCLTPDIQEEMRRVLAAAGRMRGRDVD